MRKCPTRAEWSRYVAGEFDSADRVVQMDEHVSTCAACRRAMQRIVGPQSGAALGNVLGSRERGCPSDEALVAYVSGGADEVDREIVESHVSLCVECEESVSDLRAFSLELQEFERANATFLDDEKGFWPRTGPRLRAYRLPRAVKAAAVAFALLSAMAFAAWMLYWRPASPMAFARSSAAAAVIEGKIFVFGGDHGGASSTVQAYDPDRDSWSSNPWMPGARYGFGGIGVVGRKMYVVGGWGPNWLSTDGTLHGALPNTNLWVFDPGANVRVDPSTNRPAAPLGGWYERSPIPLYSPPVSFGSCDGAAGGIGERLYVYTGHDGSNTPPSNYFHVYDPRSDRWTELPRPPVRHMNGVAGVIGGKFYLAGGDDLDYDAARGQYLGRLHGQLDVYDPATNRWTTAAPMPTARTQAAACVLEDKLYVIGGTLQLGDALDVVEIYDPSKNSWSEASPMPTPRRSLVAGAVKGTIYAIGGLDGGNRVYDIVEAYVPAGARQSAGRWVSKTPMSAR